HQPSDFDPFIGAGHPDLPALGPANRPRRRVASPPSEGNLYEADLLISHPRTRVSPWLRKRGVIGRTYEVEYLTRRTSPGQPTVLGRSFAEVLPVCEVLLDGRDRLRVLRRRLQQFPDQFHPELDALRADRKARVRFFNLEQRLVGDRPGVNSR